jgi:IMP dehydrogenase
MTTTSGKIVGEGITFDDVLILPGYSEIIPSQVNTRTRISRNIETNIPIVSAAMDTVTESRLDIALAQEGGIGIIHKNLPIDGQALEVGKVKRSESGVIHDPKTLPPDESIATARDIMREHNISGIPIVDGDTLAGILTIRDLRFQGDDSRKISEVMTRDHLVTAPMGTTLDEAKDILHKNKVEKLLLTDGSGQLAGLITIKDINKHLKYPNASKDDRGRLRCGAAVGVHDLERVEALVDAGVDLIVVDTAHGHSKNVVETVKAVKKKFDIETIAGNVATKEGAKMLVDAGVDGVKVGIGPGSICTTRIIAGIGVPQLSAIGWAYEVCKDAGVPVIGDGGIRTSGDITKAIAFGASIVMIGSLFAGTEESPGETILFKGRTYKAYRGMGSLGAMVTGSKDRYGQADLEDNNKLVPEGVEGRVPFKGPVGKFIYQLIGGLRAGMGYTGSATIEELREKAQMIRISGASLRESHPHDIDITKEAPNYWLD